MAELDRTALGSPISVPKPTRVRVDPNKTAVAIAQLGQVGGKYSQVMADEEEVALKRQAENDLINGTINPDKLQHKSAYSYVIGQGQALQSFNDLKTGIESGEYSDVDPEDFQKMLRDKHQEFYKGIQEGDTAKFQKNAYDSFTLKNEGTLKAAQAGKWRVNLGEKQGTALFTAVGLMSKEPEKYTSEHILDEIYSDKYSLLNEFHRKQAAFGGAAQIAKETGDSKILKELNEELGFVADPSFRSAYNSAIKLSDQKAAAMGEQEQYELIAHMNKQKNAGILTNSAYPLIRDIKDKDGNPVWTQKQFYSMVKDSQIIRAKLDAKDKHIMSFKDAADSMSGTKQSTFNDVSNEAFQKEVELAGGDTVSAMRSMGMYLATKSKDWDELKDRCKMFSTIQMMQDDKPNKDSMLRFQELEALEEGMDTYTNGEKTFTRYMGDSLGDYFDIKSALDAAGTNVDAAWASIAESLELQKQHKKYTADVAGISTTGKTVGIEVMEEITDEVENPFIPDFLESWMAPEDIGDSVAIQAGKLYDEAIASGKEPATARYVARKNAHANTTEFGNELFNVSEQNLKAAIGTSDLDAAYKAMLDDPIIDAELTEMFGVTLGEMYFGMDEEPVTPEDIREYSEERAGKRKFLSKTKIKKNINLETGMLEFRSERMGGQFYAIPLKSIGEIHQGKLQGLDELDLLERYYSAEHLDTDKGVTWANEQVDLNNDFVTDILGTTKAQGFTTVSKQEYIGMPDIEKTRVRKQFYKDKYSGFKGTMRQIGDFFKLKRTIDESDITINILEEIEPITNITETYTEFDIDAAKSLIKEHEGLSLEAYNDAGGKSIGYGHFLKDGEKMQNINKEKAEALFEKDFPKYHAAAKKIPGYAKGGGIRQSALINLTYNMGKQWYKKFPKFSKAYAKGDYNTAADELIESKWYNQVGESRRDTIVSMIRNG